MSGEASRRIDKEYKLTAKRLGACAFADTRQSQIVERNVTQELPSSPLWTTPTKASGYWYTAVSDVGDPSIVAVLNYTLL